MPRRKISDDTKLRVIWLADNDYSVNEICEIMDVSPRSITRWKKNILLHGTFTPPPVPIQGRLKLLNANQMHDLFTLLEESPDLYLDEIQTWIAVHHDLLISISALQVNIADAGITYKLLRRAAAERDDAERGAWRAYMTANFHSSQLVFIDESSKDERTIYCHYGRAPSGQRAVIEANFVRGDRWSVVPALTVDGYLAVRVVPGSVDGAEFFDFIVEDVVSL